MGPLLLHLALLLLFPPLLVGGIGKVKAAFAGRRGAPLLQPYSDLARLLRKGAVYSRTTTWVFRAGPTVSLAATLSAALLVPLVGARAPLGFAGDLVLFAYLLALARFALLAAALDTGSSFEGMGASREAAFSSLAEPALLLVFAAVARVGGAPSFRSLLDPAAAGAWSIAGPPAVFLLAGCLFVLALAENARIPVDDPSTHLELTMIHEAMVLDHSGPDLAFLLYAGALKLFLFGAILGRVLLPSPLGNPVLDGALFGGWMLLFAGLVGTVESTLARLRLDRVPHLLVSACVLASCGLAVLVARGVR
ncbi:MAG TPA: NADH-quinone oxidoreductase subunit H [Planctomycetota bacterium]|jgi:formate hydrogenlyase subunit 4|nr:NADH-quinone oxidoreductase subunit H [Planctomycetota bacterium]